jgi:phage shock protein PspC (stress-responsive transcriptional regulator)
MRGAPITVRCDCGETAAVAYGEKWTCERCGRRWNTAQIPADEYWGIMREMRRSRLVVIGVALGLAGTFGLLAAFIRQSIFLLAPVVITGWLILYMPYWRRKLRRQVRSLPKWKLHPE